MNSGAHIPPRRDRWKLRAGDGRHSPAPGASPSSGIAQVHAPAGFSLLEALIALAVFGIVSAVLSQAFINTLRALDTQAEIAATIDDLRFVRSQVILEADLEAFEEGGEVQTLDSGEARWEAEVELTKIPHLFQVLLTIEFEGGETIEPWTHEETLHLLRPTWSEQADTDELMADLQEAIEDTREIWNW